MRALLVISLLAAASGCGTLLGTTPRPQDSQAPRDFYASQLHREKPTCDKQVAILPAGASIGRAYKEVASLSATCSPGSPDICEQSLKNRACELAADAVIMSDRSPGPRPRLRPGNRWCRRAAGPSAGPRPDVCIGMTRSPAPHAETHYARRGGNIRAAPLPSAAA